LGERDGKNHGENGHADVDATHTAEHTGLNGANTKDASQNIDHDIPFIGHIVPYSVFNASDQTRVREGKQNKKEQRKNGR
jgi:hypothetical protein